jgi:hypothetical protein
MSLDQQVQSLHIALRLDIAPPLAPRRARHLMTIGAAEMVKTRSPWTVTLVL